MIEVHAFVAAFMVQILAMSVLFPAWFARQVRAQVAGYPAERLAQLYPGIDIGRTQERFLARYRALNIGIAALGLLLLGWLFIYTQNPDWNDRRVTGLVGAYFMLQNLPWAFVIWFAVKFNIVWFGFRFNKMHERAPQEGKRKAVLQRRGLFDFVSPFAVFVAALAYVLFVVYVIYLVQHPFSGYRDGYTPIRGVTLGYAVNAFMVARYLYGRKINPLETQADHLFRIGWIVRTLVYVCILVVLFVSLGLTLRQMDLRTWRPFAQSVFFVIVTFLCGMAVIRPPRRPDPDEAPARFAEKPQKSLPAT